MDMDALSNHLVYVLWLTGTVVFNSPFNMVCCVSAAFSHHKYGLFFFIITLECTRKTIYLDSMILCLKRDTKIFDEQENTDC